MNKKWIVLCSAVMLAGCGSTAAPSSFSSPAASSQMGCEWNATDCDDTLSTAASDIDAHVGEKADMSAYESYDADSDYVFINSDVENMLQRMNNGDTFVTFFGFSSCPWCRDAMPILNAVALDEGYEVDYINTRLDPSWESNLDLKDYDKLVDALGDLFPVDDDGKAHLDVPFVVFFKDGKVAASAGYPQYDAHERTINDEEAEEERENFTAGFEALK